jgi:hypothetical protein
MKSIEDLFGKAIGEIELMLSSKTVVGDPITVDGNTLIPLISVGFVLSPVWMRAWRMLRGRHVRRRACAAHRGAARRRALGARAADLAADRAGGATLAPGRRGRMVLGLQRTLRTGRARCGRPAGRRGRRCARSTCTIEDDLLAAQHQLQRA